MMGQEETICCMIPKLGFPYDIFFWNAMCDAIKKVRKRMFMPPMACHFPYLVALRRSVK
jgi:hypothetical protein